MAARARTAFWRMTLHANASSSGCGAMSINLEPTSNVGAVKARNDTVANKRERTRPCNRIQLLADMLPPDRSEMAIDGLRPEDRQVVSEGSLHKCVCPR